MLLLSACGSPFTLWGMGPEELQEELYRGTYESLRHISFREHPVEEVELLGEDAAYAVGRIYLQLGMPEVAEQFFRHAWQNTAPPWRWRALEELLTLLLEAERYEELEQVARKARAEPSPPQPPAPVEARARRAADLAYLESVYEQGRYGELAELLEEERGRISSGLGAGDPRAQELALWWTVSRIEGEHEDWPDDVRALYRDYPAGEVHSRLWVYLINRDGLLEPFAEPELRFFRSRQLAGEGRADEAVAILTSLEAQGGADHLLQTLSGVLELYRSGVRSGRLSAAASVLEAIGRAEPALAAVALEYAGRLYRLAGAYTPAISLLGESLSLRSPGADEQRVRWYLLSSRVRRDPVGTAEALAAEVPALEEPAYYSDLFVELAGLLAERQAWEPMLTAYGAIADFAAAGALARYELALARALETGRLYAAPARAAELRERYLRRALSQRENRFAAIMAGALLGEDAVDVLQIAEDSRAPTGTGVPANAARSEDRATAGDEPADEESAWSLLARTYERFALFDELVGVLRRTVDGVTPEFRLRSAGRLARAGRIRESVLVLSSLERAGGTLTAEAARLRYPLAYAAVVDGRVDAEQIDRATFYALLREESLFDPEISSRAGAVGLAQLIPSTAADIARRMRLEEPVLTDPADNVTIGARYFSMLTGQFGTMARALAAYNGGQGNVRRWERDAGALDEVLFHQAIPFPETYNHVRKVVVSASFYGYLYSGRAPAETARRIFALD